MPLRTFRLPRKTTAFLHDVVMAAVSFFVALALRLGDAAWQRIVDDLWLPLIIFTAVCALVFWFTGLYRGIWRYASLDDMIAIARAVTLALLVYLPVTFMLTRLDAVPRSMLVINWFVLAFLLSAPRVIYRVFKDRGLQHLLERGAHTRVPVLVIGANDAAEVFIREMARDPAAPYEVLGLVDVKGTRVGRQIRGQQVLGRLDELPEILQQVGTNVRTPQRLILASRLERDEIQRLLDLAEEQGMTLARLPRLTDFKTGSGDPIQVQPVAIEDLLGRVQTKLDRGDMGRLVEGRRVLVTGAGGSIGSELVRQIADLRPLHLTLLDNAEGLLYEIDLELGEQHPELSRDAVLADVRDRERLTRLFTQAAPDLVFHAAAFKQIPLVETNPIEGVVTNVDGTRNTADACRKAGVAGMVLISTDKAINPSSVMGATKRLAESYCQALDLTDGTHTRFVTVRFGNVLGSTGSVVPLFQRQLAAGGPLTVTHPDMERYFMTVREAVELVLQASALGMEGGRDDSGKIYVLNMGEPVKITELARQMIRLAGLRPERDVEIVYTGPRPGEKLTEELFHDHESLVATRHPGLLLAAPRTTNLELLIRGLDELAERAGTGQGQEVLDLLQRLVPEYRPAAPQARAAS
jgi:O-antigen biosynthesis protein WbqV